MFLASQTLYSRAQAMPARTTSLTVGGQENMRGEAKSFVESGRRDDRF